MSGGRTISGGLDSGPNTALTLYRDLLMLTTPDAAEGTLRDFGFEWQNGSFNPDSKLAKALNQRGMINVTNSAQSLTQIGQLFISRLLINIPSDEDASSYLGSLSLKYTDFRVLANGKNSIILKAKHKLLKKDFLIKLIRPGASSDLSLSMATLSLLPADEGIILPIDFSSVVINDLFEQPVSLDYLVFPLALGKTFGQFLKQDNHRFNSQIAIAFAEVVGNALLALERIGAYHGDLHENNILVDSEATQIDFKLIDVSYGSMGSASLSYCKNSDLENFKIHILRLLNAQRERLPQLSLRKYIGTKNYDKITSILSKETTSFADVKRILDDDFPFKTFAREKAEFVDKHFRQPVSFRLQRYEEITDPAVAIQLFVPYDPLMERMVDFSNIYVSGNRGSGKSTYLAALGFFPQAERALVDFRTTFGVYFPCRQGEFRALASRSTWTCDHERDVTTSILVVKIVRRTIEALLDGVLYTRIAHPSSLARLRLFVSGLASSQDIISIQGSIQAEIENLAATMIRIELEHVSSLSKPPTGSFNKFDALTLMEFFRIVRDSFSELSTTRFHLLFDDVGVPYVPENVQKALNDLILSSNPFFCIKISAEKYTFTFQSSYGKALESGQDYFEHDISHTLSIGSGSAGLNRDIVEKYFRRIVDQRLQYFNYKSDSINDYLGNEPISVDRLLVLLAIGRKDAYYCGWSTVWNIADRTPRNLLELVSEIFSAGNIDNMSVPKQVPMRDQDRAIRTISEKRLESLSQIPGSVSIGGQPVSLGRCLFECTAVIGSTFRIYLRSEKNIDGRKRQHLAIERNDSGELSSEAEQILRRLVTFGVLDSGRATFARDDRLKKPFYVLNRIYCPAFSIGFRRDDHLRLSQSKFEMLLLSPTRFMSEGTKKLRQDSEGYSVDLFGYRGV